MEPHKVLELGTDEEPSLSQSPREYFLKSFAFARKHYGDEMDSISAVSLKDVTPDLFFREYVWVVHATGFSAKAVGKFMPRLMDAYGPWIELSKEKFEDAFKRVALVCNNPQKAKAVHKTAGLIASIADWKSYRDSKLDEPHKLSELPYVGKITCFHLGRNIGLLECVKPDLHLVRMAEHWGFQDCETMCKEMRKGGHEDVPLGIVDLALWYAASTFGTLKIKKDGRR